MIVLHAALCGKQLYLWGETPPEEHSQNARIVGEAHPFAADSQTIAEALQDTAYDDPVRKRDFRRVYAWLPTYRDAPVASSGLIAEPPPEPPSKQTPWAVTALTLDVNRAIKLLAACVDKQVLKPGAVVGDDLAWWTAAMRFAGALLERQQFLPDLIWNGKSYCARWKPVFAGPDAARLRELSAAMPPACDCLTMDKTFSPQPALTTVSNFIGEAIDFVVRHAPGRPPAAIESVHDRWLVALQSDDATLEGSPAELAEFASQVREWQRPISVSVQAPFRLCFRLEEPAEDRHEKWRVNYFLQANDDPSLLVPAEAAWKGRSRELRLLERNGFQPREHLLLSLGQAAAICPFIENSLKSPAPSGYQLDTTGAHDFLSQKAAALEQSGFGVMLPAWWTRKRTKLRLQSSVHAKSPYQDGGGLSLDQLIHFEWQVALGGEQLSLRELESLARMKAPLVKWRGQWVQMSAEEIQTALDFWKKKSTGTATVREIVQMALGAAKLPGAMELEGVTVTGWVADLLAQLQGSVAFQELPPPGELQGTLRPYQMRGYSWLSFLRRWGLGACLADDMGLGKTIQTLALIERDRQANGKHPVLLVCPTSVVGNWQKEAARFTPNLPVMVHHGSGRVKGEAFAEQAGRHAIVLSSYALLHRDLEILKQAQWSGVVLDEAQNIKNPSTRQATAARSLQADYRIALTGTPVENNVGDLWSIMEFLNPGFLPPPAEFKQKFFIPIQTGRDPEAAEKLKRLTGPFILRRLKTDRSIITDLPDKMEMKVFCTLTREQASLYAAVVEDAAKALEKSTGIQRKGVVLATLSKLKQVCNHPAQFLGDNSALPGRSGKLARLTEMTDELLQVGDRALIFSQFSEMGGILRRHLQETFGREVLFLHGGVSKPQRDRMVERFQQEENGPNLFILSLKAGGTGLNLTRASHVFHFDRWWNPAVENQATDRAFRIGQTKNVQVHKFLCTGTLEEKIDEMIERKKTVAANVVGAGEAWLTELSTAELKELFALRKEAVAE